MQKIAGDGDVIVVARERDCRAYVIRGADRFAEGRDSVVADRHGVHARGNLDAGIGVRGQKAHGTDR